MKTSLNLDDSLFQAALKESQKTKKTLSETISHWARVGRDALMKGGGRASRRKVKPVDLGGGARVDINSRSDWMDQLEA